VELVLLLAHDEVGLLGVLDKHILFTVHWRKGRGDSIEARARMGIKALSSEWGSG